MKRPRISNQQFLRRTIRVILGLYCVALAISMTYASWHKFHTREYASSYAKVVHVEKQIASKTEGYRFRGSTYYYYAIEVRHTVNGREYTSRPFSYNDRIPYSVGQTVPVLYDPKTPEIITLDNAVCTPPARRIKDFAFVIILLLMNEIILGKGVK